MNSLTIQQIETDKEIHKLSQFISKQPQYYPNFQNWIIGKLIPRSKSKEYITIVAINSNKEIIGNATYQTQTNKLVAIKNFRIDPYYQHQDLGHFLLSQVIHSTHNSDLNLDITIDNFAGVEFFIRNKFKIVKKEKLYLPTQDEYIMCRKFN